MPDDVTLWLVVVVVAAAVVVFAVWSGYNVNAGSGGLTASLTRPQQPDNQTTTNVGENLELTKATVGDVIGERVSGTGSASSDGRVEVLKNARIAGGSRTGDIIGRDVRAGSPPCG